MSDQVGLDPPGFGSAIVWHDRVQPTSLIGLGCSSNGRWAACTFAHGSKPNLAIYDFDGNVRWHAGSLLGRSAWASAPMVATDGSVIAADNAHLIRFDNDGHVLWRTPTPGGVPISPVITKRGIVLLATANGPLSAYDATSGKLLSTLWLRDGPRDPHFFDTVNTPALRGDRAYILAQRNQDGENPDNWGRLVAVDFDAEHNQLAQAWHVDFGARSGASPLLIDRDLFFDGGRPAPGEDQPRSPTIFAVRDDGRSAKIRWTKPVDYGVSVRASMAKDPRGGFWHFSAYDTRIIRLDETTGDLVQEIDLDLLIGDPRVTHGPSSAMSIAGREDRPIMILGVAPLGFGASYIAAVDLVLESLVWKVQLSARALFPLRSTSAQFPILRRNGESRVVAASWHSGVFGIGLPEPRDRASTSTRAGQAQRTRTMRQCLVPVRPASALFDSHRVELKR
jgi:hypothetical protein